MTGTEIINLLESYPKCECFISAQEYAVTYFNGEKVDQKETYRQAMSLIEGMIGALAPSDESTILHLHYVKGIPVEKCA